MRRILLLPLVPLLFTACASDDTEYSSHASTTYAAHEPREHPPHVGMSKDEVRKLYGEPESILHGPKGEAWRYWFNRGTAAWTGRARVAIIIFGPNGIVKDYVWNE